MWSIELKNISKRFGDKQVIQDINLKVNEGEMISLLGPSGCGKSTTLKIISGLLEPDSGDILFNGSSVANVPVEKRGAVIVFQDYRLFPHMTVEENIGFGLKMAKVDKSIRIQKVKEMIDLVQLNGVEKKYPSEISGGQKQRTALARALAISPKVLLLDEPFSNLDQRLRESMREFVQDLQRKLKITTILVTHDKEEALMLSDRIALMFNGKVVQFGTPDELYKRPVNRAVADFFGDNNYIEGVIDKGVFKCKFGSYKVNIEKSCSVTAMIRPENIRLKSREKGSELWGVVTKKRYAGDRIYYSILIQGVELKCIESSRNVFEIGNEVEIYIDFNNGVYYENDCMVI
jgi:ABC-type Fe3+/spermidine/putrescine transport system ATPase subunit